MVPLSGGAALLLSNSAFLTPKHQIIDHVCPAAVVGMLKTVASFSLLLLWCRHTLMAGLCSSTYV